MKKEPSLLSSSKGVDEHRWVSVEQCPGLACDCGGLYRVGSFPNWGVWGEWNGRFRNDVRRFVKGDQGMKAAFATRLAGSADMYNVNQR